MQFVKRLSQLSGLNSLRKYHASRIKVYTSITELPIFLWWKVHETSDITHILKKKVKITDKVANHLISVWEKMEEEHEEMFGVSDHYKAYIRLITNIAIRKLNMAMTGDTKNIVHINIMERELNNDYKKEDSNNYYTKALLEKVLGIRIDPRTTTVVEYENYALLAKDVAKAESKAQ